MTGGNGSKTTIELVREALDSLDARLPQVYTMEERLGRVSVNQYACQVAEHPRRRPHGGAIGGLLSRWMGIEPPERYLKETRDASLGIMMDDDSFLDALAAEGIKDVAMPPQLSISDSRYKVTDPFTGRINIARNTLAYYPTAAYAEEDGTLHVPGLEFRFLEYRYGETNVIWMHFNHEFFDQIEDMTSINRFVLDHGFQQLPLPSSQGTNDAVALLNACLAEAVWTEPTTPPPPPNYSC